MATKEITRGGREGRGGDEKGREVVTWTAIGESVVGYNKECAKRMWNHNARVIRRIGSTAVTSPDAPDDVIVIVVVAPMALYNKLLAVLP